MIAKNIFVTVGTTKFPKLINTITSKEILDILISLQCKFIQVQSGKDFTSVCDDPTITLSSKVSNDNYSIVKFGDNITVKYDQYFENFNEQIQNCDLVISHAGAGTCLEVLYSNKPLVVVINEDLMDNHQIELAEELEKNGYLFYCTCNSLKDTLKKDFSKLKSYPKPTDPVFSSYLDKCMGFPL